MKYNQHFMVSFSERKTPMTDVYIDTLSYNLLGKEDNETDIVKLMMTDEYKFHVQRTTLFTVPTNGHKIFRKLSLKEIGVLHANLIRRLQTCIVLQRGDPLDRSSFEQASRFMRGRISLNHFKQFLELAVTLPEEYCDDEELVDFSIN